MSNNSPENIDVKKWVMEAPTPPAMVVETLKAAKVGAWFVPKFEGGKDSETSGTIRIKSTFANLPITKQILENAGVKRKRWPRPQSSYSRGKANRQKFRLNIKCDIRGPIILTYLTIRLTPEQALKLRGYAVMTGQSQEESAQALFKYALALRCK
jgi:hypothetical protein